MAPHASKTALEAVKDHEIDLFALQWKDQKKAEQKLGKTNGREIIYNEHEIPVEDLFNKILQVNSKAALIKCIKFSSIVWITREEEKRLKKFKREKDAYAKAGIVRLNNPHKDKWIEMGWDLRKRNTLF